MAENKNALDEVPSKEIQNAIVKLWELIRNAGDKVETSEKNLSLLTERNAEIEVSLRKRDAELSEVRSKFAVLQEDIETLKLRNDDLTKNLENNTHGLAELEETKFAFFELEKEKNALEQKVLILREKAALVPGLNQEIDDLKQAGLVSEEKTASLNQEIDRLTRIAEDFTHAQREIARRNLDLNEKAREILKLKEDLAASQSIIFSLRTFEKDKNESMEIINVLNADLAAKDEEISANITKFEAYKQAYNEEKSKLENEIAACRHIISEHESSISELYGKAMKAKSDFDEIEFLNLELQTQIEDLTKEITVKSDKIIELIEKQNVLTKENEELFNSLNEANNKIVEITKEKESLLTKLDEVKSILEESAKAIEDYETKTSELTELFEESEKINKELKVNVAEKEASLKLAQDQMLRDSSRILELEGQINIIDSKLNITKNENSELSEKAEKLDELQAKLDELTPVLAELEKTAAELKTALEAKTSELTDKVSELTKIQYENEELLNQNLELEDKLEKEQVLAAKAAKYEKDNEELNSANADLQNKIDELVELAAKLENVQKENSELKVSLDEFGVNLANSTEAVARLEARDKENIDAIESLKSDNEKLFAELDILTVEKKSLIEKIELIQTQGDTSLGELSSELSRVLDEKKELEDKLNELKTSLESALNEALEKIKALSDELENTALANEELKIELADKVSVLQSKDDELISLSKDKEQALATIDEFQKELDAKTAEILALKEIENEYSVLKGEFQTINLELEKLRGEREVQAAIFENMKAENAALARKGSEFEIERNEQIKAKEDAEAMLDEYQKELDSKIAEIAELKELAVQLEKLKGEREVQAAIFENMKAENAALARKGSEFEIERNEQIELKNQALAQIEELTKQIEDIKLQVENLVNEKGDLTNKLSATEVDLEQELLAKQNAEQNVLSLQKDIQNKQDELNNLANVLQDLKSERNELNSKINELEESLSSARKDLFAEKEKNLSVGISASSKESEIIELQAQINTLSSQIAAKEAKLAESEGISILNLKQKEEIDALKAENANLSKEMESVKFANEKAEAEKVARLEFMVQELSNEKSAKESRMSNLQTKIDGLEDLLQNRFDHIKLLEQEVEELAKKRARERKEREALADKLEKVVGKLENYSLF